MTFSDLLARVAEIMTERSKPENLMTTFVQLIVVMALAAIPFIGVPIALLVFLAIIASYWNQ